MATTSKTRSRKTGGGSAATWGEFATAQPEMARALTKILEWIPISYIATVRRDGSPRVHPFCPIFARGRMFIAINPTSPKRWDLVRDGRFSMHALPGKQDDEFYLTGRATRIDDDADLRQAVVEGAGHTVHPGRLGISARRRLCHDRVLGEDGQA